MTTETTNYWLSIDYDFFVREDPMWDWGHKESPFFRDFMWTSRAMGAVAGGFDLRSLMDPAQWAAPKPLEFTGMLAKKGIIIDDACEVLVSDSHCFGFSTFAGHETPDALLSFDAHHDLGYSVKKIEDHKRRQQIHCDDWLAMLMDLHPNLETHVIYPGWKKEWLYEWQHIVEIQSGEKDAPWWLEDVVGRVRHKIWTPDITFEPGTVNRIHICRSGSWVPPWLDELFGDFVANVAMATNNEPETPYIDFEDCDPLEPRDFDWGQIEVMGLEQKEAMDRIRQINREKLDLGNDNLERIKLG